MAQRRMFSKKITETDLFLDMPMSAQCLYFHLNMSADDDGFIGNAKTIRRMIGASEDDLKLLLAKEFLIPFDNGVVVIKDWKIHNYIQKDRYNETIYKDEKASLVENENKQYQRLSHMDTKCIQNVSSTDTQVRLGKDRLGKDSKDKGTTPAPKKKKTPVKHKYGEYQNVLLSDEQLEKLKKEFPKDYQDRIERVSIYCESSGKTYKNYLATIRNWAKKDKEQKSAKKLKNERDYDEYGDLGW